MHRMSGTDGPDTKGANFECTVCLPVCFVPFSGGGEIA
jgi:hypothetical protein